MGTHWVLEGNMLGKMTKKSRHFELMLSLPIIDWREISISKTVCHHF
jgi:hypothetical protein